eukprot:TRINITY_DN20112_c0_g1_i3.p1 TRINITY_DN20112_c0_g1~~TRINITY_DN20112_c0_g1_i3.p1  ORF type:complete len:585 (+),score=112.27 TRINITY_DN20112_c0_g1_i3:157-1911(+)
MSMCEGDVKDRLLRIFRAFDLDGDGAIARDELARVLKALDKDKWTDDQLSEFLEAADLNGDGLIQYEEFLSWVADVGEEADIVTAGQSAADTCPSGMNGCRYRDKCYNRDPRHRKRFWHPIAQDISKFDSQRRACRFGSSCYRRSQSHMASYVHPGDRNYRTGLVIFGQGKQPEFETLWQVFKYYDPDESGYLKKEEFVEAAEGLKRFCSGMSEDMDENWTQAGGGATGYVNLALWCTFGSAVGAELPLGIENESAAKPCQFRIMVEGGWSCGCDCFEEGEDGFLCACGHKPSMHRSDMPVRSLTATFAEGAGPSWDFSEEGLVECTDGTCVALMQELFDGTHKETDNWTRDRGCSIHGRSHPECDWKCMRRNGNRVPTGFNVVKVFKNQNKELWAKYRISMMSITEETKREEDGAEHVMHPVASENLGGNLDVSINEWRLFHGTGPGACRGICATNFRLSLSGTGATWKDPGADKGSPLYGFGIYLAERVTKSDEYSETLPEDDENAGLNVMLVCRCVGGRSNLITTNEIDKEQLRNDVFDGPYHSVFGDRVVNLGKPYREIVVYDKDQIFPEYLVLYERKFD